MRSFLPHMVPPQRSGSEQYEENKNKPRKSTRSKSHEFMCSDWTTLRGDTLGQVKSKSLQVPHHRRSEGAATKQRPGVSTSSTRQESPEESPALYSILACLFLWMLCAQGEAPSHIAAVALAFCAVFPSACAVASDLPHALWEAIKEAGGYLFYFMTSHGLLPSACYAVCLLFPAILSWVQQRL